MSSPQHGIPRGYADLRGGPGRRYMAVCAPFPRLFGGTVPAEAGPLLKAYGRLAVDIDRVHAELEQALARRRQRDVRRYRRQLAGMNRDLLTFTARLEEQASRRARRRPMDAIAARPEVV